MTSAMTDAARSVSDREPPKPPTHAVGGTPSPAAERNETAMTEALAWASAQLEGVLATPPPGRERRAERQVDQFLEAEGDEEYRLDAAEDREAYHRWLAGRREPVVVGTPTATVELRAATRAPRRGV